MNARGVVESVLKHCSCLVAMTFPYTLVKDNVPQLYIKEIHDSFSFATITAKDSDDSK